VNGYLIDYMKSPEGMKAVVPSASDRQDMTDAELMAGVAAGDGESLGELSRRYRDVVFHLGWRMMGDSSAAEDITQEAFLRVYQASKGYRPEAKFTTWLYRIAVNLCLDEKRRLKRTASFFSTIQRMWSSNVVEPVEKKEEEEDQRLLVRQAIDRLNPRQRLVLLLHRFDGLGHEEIASITGWSRSSVESLLVRAYKKLRSELSELEKKYG